VYHRALELKLKNLILPEAALAFRHTGFGVTMNSDEKFYAGSWCGAWLSEDLIYCRKHLRSPIASPETQGP
jgi:hypothetical protein